MKGTEKTSYDDQHECNKTRFMTVPEHDKHNLLENHISLPVHPLLYLRATEIALPVHPLYLRNITPRARVRKSAFCANAPNSGS